MNDKDYARLIKEYEKLHASEPEEYIMDMKEEFESLISSMGDEFRSFSKEKQIRILIKLAGSDLTRQYKYDAIFSAEPPVMHLAPPVRKRYMLDNERFEKELIAEILKY